MNIILGEKEQTKLKQILKEIEKLEKSRICRYLPYIVIAILIILTLFVLVVGSIFKYNDAITVGVILGTYTTIIITWFRQNKIIYRIIKNLYDQLRSNSVKVLLSDNEYIESKWPRIVAGLCLIIGGLMMAFRNELMYLITGANFFLKSFPYVIPFKIIGFTMAIIGFLIIIIPIMRRR